MGASREKDQADFDLERFVELFDECMTSTNPAVQKAFKNLLLVASISHSDTKHFPVSKGPLRRLVDDVHQLHRRIERMEDNVLRERQPDTSYEQMINSAKAMHQAQAPLMIPAQQLEQIKRNIK
jgi:hypothetical protein